MSLPTVEHFFLALNMPGELREVRLSHPARCS
jgi:hypothetical protein